MKKTKDDNTDEVEKRNILNDIHLINETIVSILIFVLAIILLLKSSFLSKLILENRLKGININIASNPSELSITASELILIALIVAADVAFKRLAQKEEQAVKGEAIEPYRMFTVAAVIRIAAAILGVIATKEVAKESQVRVVQQL